MSDPHNTHFDGCWRHGSRHYQCALDEVERLREQLAAARAAALEEAAKVCGDQFDPYPERHFDEGYNQAVRDCADAIRALKEKRDE